MPPTAYHSELPATVINEVMKPYKAQFIDVCKRMLWKGFVPTSGRDSASARVIPGIFVFA